MWGPSIMFMIMGSVPYISKRLGGNVKEEVVPVYRNMFRTGLIILIFCLLGLFLNDPFDIVLPTIPILFFGLWSIVHLNKVISKDAEEK